ncbi:hypothetical protein VN97_g6778 [Penicillium thymicola]|uniref:Uncharacterized protein n=1 Tax=Penicillium thymicola TaxID=293382 RepID=A0AAI9THI3_PENTH|nr:hypothetical protein VN97_g6778 [Penicillium thymicola]
MSDVCLHLAFLSHRHDFSLIHLPHLSPAFCSPVLGKPGADWEVKRGTSSSCWNATSSTIYPAISSALVRTSSWCWGPVILRDEAKTSLFNIFCFLLYFDSFPLVVV